MILGKPMLFGDLLLRTHSVPVRTQLKLMKMAMLQGDYAAEHEKAAASGESCGHHFASYKK